MSENPGPDVAVIALAPATEAPMTAAIDAISSSIWIKCPPTRGRLRASNSAISVDGVIGYPAKKRHPAARAPNPQASFPCISNGWLALYIRNFCGFDVTSVKLASEYLLYRTYLYQVHHTAGAACFAPTFLLM